MAKKVDGLSFSDSLRTAKKEPTSDSVEMDKALLKGGKSEERDKDKKYEPREGNH